jgi:hypothetical protein
MSPAPRLLQQIARLCTAGALLLACMPATALNEADVKAAVVANLLAFAEWPPRVTPPAEAALVLCVGARHALRAPLATLNGRTVRQWVLQVRELGAGDATAACHALLVDEALLAARPALAGELRTLPLLSFADAREAADAPVCIRIGVVDGRVGFTVDLANARAIGVTLSSRMLRLAREVKE